MNLGLIVLMAAMAAMLVLCTRMRLKTVSRGCGRGCSDCPNRETCHRTRWKMD